MSASVAFGSTFSQPIGDQIVDFPRLLMEDYGTLENTVRAERRQVHRALLDDCKITGPDRFVALREVEVQDVQAQDVDRYLCTAAGTRKALVMSLSKAGKSPDDANAIIAKMDQVTATRLARILIGFIIPSEKDPEKPDGDKSSPNPPAA